jgi:hypothetical protein
MLILLSSTDRLARISRQFPPTFWLSPAAPKLHFRARNPLWRFALRRASGRVEMLETIAIILIVLWLLGVVSGYTMGNFIYVLLIVAIVLFLVRLIGGRRVV